MRQVHSHSHFSVLRCWHNAVTQIFLLGLGTSRSQLLCNCTDNHENWSQPDCKIVCTAVWPMSLCTRRHSWHWVISGWPLSRQCEISWQFLTFPWQFTALLRGTRHVKCYSYRAPTSVTVSGDPKPYVLTFKTQQTPTKYMYGQKYAVYNEQF